MPSPAGGNDPLDRRAQQIGADGFNQVFHKAGGLALFQIGGRGTVPAQRNACRPMAPCSQSSHQIVARPSGNPRSEMIRSKPPVCCNSVAAASAAATVPASVTVYPSVLSNLPMTRAVSG